MLGKRGKHKRLHSGIILDAEEADNERSFLIFKVCVSLVEGLALAADS